MNLYLTDKKYIHRNLPHFERVFCFGNGKPLPKVTWIDSVKKPTWRDIIGAVNNRSHSEVNVIGDRFFDSSVKKLNFVNLYGKCVQIGKAYVFQGMINISKEGDFKKNLAKNYEVIKQKKVKYAKRYDNLIAITSISPKHNNFNQQYEAINTWQKYFKVYSLNCEEEIKLLKRKFPSVEFVPVKTTMRELIGKPLVRINDMLDLAKDKKKDALIINSDIILTDFPEPKEGIGIITRHNYDDVPDEAQQFRFGFDAFLVPNKFLDIYPPTDYAMGVCWWDMAIPYIALTKRVKIYFVREKIALHKNHPVQYHPSEWKKFGQYFRWQNNLDSFENIGDLNTWVRNTIKSKCIKKAKLKTLIVSDDPNDKPTIEKVKGALPQYQVTAL